MTLEELYLKAKKQLIKTPNSEPNFEVMSMLEFFFNITRQDFILKRKNKIKQKEVENFLKLISERANGKPLQYILGYWYFMGKKFFVNKKVLIPREDTQVLVETAVELLKNKNNVKILELCVGTGIISIMLEKLLKNPKIVGLEISDSAIKCAKKNLILHKTKNVELIKFNILKDSFMENDFDLVIANPPYIKSGDFSNLQKEVQNEPYLALNGGKDGLLFYKKILKNFRKNLKTNAYIALELGINQNKNVESLLEKNKFYNIGTKRDLNNIKRVIFGAKSVTTVHTKKSLAMHI
ncbi:MAG: peptide chain release factor N(5)-glutamine methyltransferase [Oscillospiraceae bacterium]|jgi:release factor glutamine methyltransferase|nr:peptide chain release factor N(5)-glutamine methyltransferase [Oscillospiraceae bacterium]